MTPLAVVIPTKNRRQLLERALASVWAQGYPRMRVIVVDDGSTDSTHEYLSSRGDERLTTIRFDESRGVNAARNAALKTARGGEWVILLDDDDLLLPGALAVIDAAIVAAPDAAVLTFASRIKTPEGEFVGGYRFAPDERHHDATYAEIMTKRNTRGDGRSVFKAELFARYAYEEDINGFEGEFNMRLARDGVPFRYLPEQIIFIDQAHGEERLSDTASVRDPAAFARAHARIFRDHAAFLAEHPDIARHRALEAFKVAVRARDMRLAARFAGYCLRAMRPGARA